MIDRATIEGLLNPLPDVAEPDTAAGAGPRARQEALERALALEPLDGARWAELGKLLWERAVEERSEERRRQAQRCLDLARLLTWPWRAGPPLADHERMQMTRFGRPPRAQWPEDDDPDEVRRGALAFLADPGAAAASM